MDVETFKVMVKGSHIHIYQQCRQAAMVLAVAVKAMAVRGMLYTDPCEEVEFANELWVACGYDDIMDTVSTVIMQVVQNCALNSMRIRGSTNMCLPFSKCCCFVPALWVCCTVNAVCIMTCTKCTPCYISIAGATLLSLTQSVGIGQDSTLLSLTQSVGIGQDSSSWCPIACLIALLLSQGKIRGVDPADCQALSDITDLSAAVLRQHDMLDAFEKVAIPKLNTWVVARVTGNTAQPSAITQTAPNSAVTSTALAHPAAEHGASAVAPDAAATFSASAGGVEAATRSAENKRSYAKMMQAGAGGSSRAPQDADGDKQAGQVRTVRPLALCA